MFRRRIEITRERRTRLTFRDTAPPRCPACGLVPELVPLAEAAVRVRVPPEDIERATESGLLQVWDAGEHRLVCLRCIHNLKGKDEHA